jgi:hypothetical protein
MKYRCSPPAGERAGSLCSAEAVRTAHWFGRGELMHQANHRGYKVTTTAATQKHWWTPHQRRYRQLSAHIGSTKYV